MVFTEGEKDGLGSIPMCQSGDRPDCDINQPCSGGTGDIMKKHTYQKVALLACAITAQAQNPTAQTEDLNHLIVTAGIAPIESDQFGGSVTVIDAAELAAMQATYLADVLRTVPGFAINQSGGPGTQTQLRVRGSEANHVLVLVDGVRVNDPTANDEFLFNYAMLDDVERIEIIRGPQSAIWGTDAVSAVINIITHDGNQNDSILADLSYGSFNTKKLGLSGQLSGTKWNLSTGIQALDSAGTNISRSGSEADGFENLSRHFKLNVLPVDDLKLTFAYRRQDATNEFDGTDFVVTGLPVDADLWTERQQLTGQVGIQYSPAAFWQAGMQYHWSDTEGQNFTHGLGVTSATSSDTDTLEVDSSWYFGANAQHRFSLRGDHRQIDFVQRGEASPFGDPNQRQSYHVTGLAAEYHHQWSEAFSWNLSARNDDFNRFEDVSNAKLAAAYQLHPNWRLRGTYGTGSKAPSFIERFGFFPANFIGNPNLKPEQSDAFEVAVAYSGSKSQVEWIYFDQDLRDEINGFVFDPASGLFTAANKSGDSQRRGMELIWQTQLSDQWGISGNYTYTDATEQAADGTDVTEVRRPENMAHVAVDFSFADGRGQLYCQVNYQDDQLDVFFDPTSFVSSQVKLDAYTTVDLTFNWHFSEALHLFVKGQNIFNESYEEVLGYARPGAAYTAGVKARF